MFTNILLYSGLFVSLYATFYPREFIIYMDMSNIFIHNLYTMLEPKLITLSYNLIYYYSYLQSRINKICRYLTPLFNYVKNNINNLLITYKLVENNKTTIEYYLHGNFIKRIVRNCNIFELNESIRLTDEYDLITITELNSLNEIQHMNVYCITGQQESIDFTPSKIKFLSLECIYQDKNYNIELKTDKLNFYMNESIINNKFVKYYIKNVLNCSDDINDDLEFNYTLNLLDHNVNFHTISHNEHIILKENEYIVKNNAELKMYNENEDKKENDKEENDKKEEEEENINESTLDNEKSDINEADKQRVHSVSEDFVKLDTNE